MICVSFNANCIIQQNIQNKLNILVCQKVDDDGMNYGKTVNSWHKMIIPRRFIFKNKK